MYKAVHSIAIVVLVCVVMLAAVQARPQQQHFGDSNQVIGEQDLPPNVLGGGSSGGLTDLQLELLAQRLQDYQMAPPAGWERMIRTPEMKRQSRFRQCYFNPVSCFKK